VPCGPSSGAVRSRITAPEHFAGAFPSAVLHACQAPVVNVRLSAAHRTLDMNEPRRSRAKKKEALEERTRPRSGSMRDTRSVLLLIALGFS